MPPPTDSDCKAALAEYAANWGKHPGVQGLGIGETSHSGLPACCVNVYVLPSAKSHLEEDLPREVLVKKGEYEVVVSVQIIEQESLHF
jgi:hypothetical protein